MRYLMGLAAQLITIAISGALEYADDVSCCCVQCYVLSIQATVKINDVYLLIMCMDTFLGICLHNNL